MLKVIFADTDRLSFHILYTDTASTTSGASNNEFAAISYMALETDAPNKTTRCHDYDEIRNDVNDEECVSRRATSVNEYCPTPQNEHKPFPATTVVRSINNRLESLSLLLFL